MNDITPVAMTALAAAAGIAPGYLSEIENGKKPGSAATLKALATTLRVDMQDLMPATDNAAG